MRTFLETEEQTDTEITLGMKSLLGIFFGLVLVCGVFFGFGYSLGRGGSNPATAVGGGTPTAKRSLKSLADQAPPAVTSDAESASASGDGVAPVPNEPAPRPVAGDDGTRTAPTPKPAATVIRSVPQPAAPKPIPPTPSLAKPSAGKVAPPPPSAATAPPATTPAPVGSTPVGSTPAGSTEAASGSTMVQIAAVSRQEDADVLVAALRKRGYSVAIRHETKDALLHVQLGPFATRDEAKVMRAKLLGDGYNAILK